MGCGELALDEQFVSYASFYTRVRRLDTEQFVQFIEKEREHTKVKEQRASARRIRDSD